MNSHISAFYETFDVPIARAIVARMVERTKALTAPAKAELAKRKVRNRKREKAKITRTSGSHKVSFGRFHTV